MKKRFTAPIMSVKQFDLEDVIKTSGPTTGRSAQDKVNSNIDNWMSDNAGGSTRGETQIFNWVG